MWKKTISILMAAFFPVCFQGADFQIRILSCPRNVPRGAPVAVTAEIKNVSGHPIVVAKGAGGFHIQASAWRSDGQPRAGCPPPWTGERALGFKAETLPENWVQQYAEDITCNDEAGELIVQVVASSKGPYAVYEKGALGRSFTAWEGVIRSEEVRIALTEPEGLDAKAYKAFKGFPLANETDLLKDFPTSTYAGYAVYEKFRGSIPGARFPNTAAIGEDAQKYALTLVAPRPEDKIYKAPDKVIRENIAIIDAVLRSHPDFAFHYGLEFYAGLQHLQLQEFTLAVQAFKKCTEADAPPLLADTAKIYLEVLKERGWK